MSEKPRILIVEDDAFYREFLVRTLSQDCLIDQAESGAQALDSLRRGSYDAILCDLRLPGMSGPELIRRIREKADEEIILIVITGFEKDWPPVEATEARVFFYLKKGEFGPRDLKKVLQSGLLLRQSRIESRRYAEQLRVLNLELEKKVEERTRALVESEAKYRNLFEQSMVGVYIEQAGQIRLVNRKLCQLLGHHAEALVGRSLARFLEPVPMEGSSIAAYGLDEASAGVEEVVLKTRVGTRRNALHGYGPIQFQGARAVQGCLLDITAWKALEQQIVHHQKMESLGTLASGFAHEFNNILTAILPQAELLTLKAREVPAIGRSAEILHRMTQKACGLTRQLLGMSREAAALERKPVEVNRRIHETLSVLSSTLGSKIQVQLQLDPEAGRIEADPDQIDQILMNILLNSRDAMPEGGRIRVATAVHRPSAVGGKAEKGGGQALVEIVLEDTGLGIAEENLPRIFDPFFTTKEPGKGTGLGLSVVYSMVKKHRGEILVNSRPGSGSTFRLLFPRLAPAPPPATAEKGKGARAGRILVADPDPATRDLFRDVLSRMHYDVIPAESGQEALDIYSRRKDEIDWVILDGRSGGRSSPSPVHRMVTINPRVKLIVTHPGASAGSDSVPDLPVGSEARIWHLPVHQAPELLSLSLEKVLEPGPSC
ncbi:MAG: response regulator [bacterium]